MITVIDASVALKWFLPAEPDREQALGVLASIGRSPGDYAVPELFFNEMVSVLCRTQGSNTTLIQQYVTDLEELGMHRVGNGHSLLMLAVQYAREWKLTGYDAIYAATAELLGGTWLTADRKAAQRVKKRGLARLLTAHRG